MNYDNEMCITFRAIAKNESFARMAISSFAVSLDPQVSELTEIKTAVSEAVTNSIVHAYDNNEGIVNIWCAIKDRTIYIEVSDEGKGIDDIEKAKEPLFTTKPDEERSGLGFTIMESFMDKVEVKSKLNHGTKVFMLKKINSDLPKG